VPRRSAEPLASADAIRRMLIGELAAILQIDESQVDTAKPFDEYGLDSTDAIIVVGLVEEQLQIELEPELLIRNRTVDEVVNSLKRLGRLS
jgi:acyl carrier protein